MTRVPRRIVPLLLLATLLVSAPPVHSGGRDVPENKSTGGNSNASWPRPPLSCADHASLIWLGGVPYTVSVRADGTAQLEPSLAGVWDRFVDAVRSFGFGDGDETTCP